MERFSLFLATLLQLAPNREGVKIHGSRKMHSKVAFKARPISGKTHTLHQCCMSIGNSHKQWNTAEQNVLKSKSLLLGQKWDSNAKDIF